MSYNYEDEEIECEIIKSYGVFSAGYKSWNKEVNLVSWNGRPAKLDIRSWQKDHEKCGKGIALTMEEAEELARLLNEILKNKTGAKSERTASRAKKSQASQKKATWNQTSKKQASKKQASRKPQPPISLEPFYKELEMRFGAEPGKCKSARNTLLKKYHPDKYPGNTTFATKKTIRIKEAYDAILAWWNTSG
jgi:hypothetical protein